MTVRIDRQNTQTGYRISDRVPEPRPLVPPHRTEGAARWTIFSLLEPSILRCRRRVDKAALVDPR